MAENLLRIVVQDDGRPPPRPAAPSTAPGAGPPPSGTAPSPPRAAVPTIPPVPPPARQATPAVPPPVPPPRSEFRPGIEPFDEIFNPTPPPAPKLYEPPAAEPATDALSAALGGVTADLGDALRRLAEQVTDTTRSLAGADNLSAALGSLADESEDLGAALKQLAEQATGTTVAPQTVAPPAEATAEPVFGFREEVEAAPPEATSRAETPPPETFGFAEEPATAPTPAAEPEGDWYAKYRELQNRYDRLQEEGISLSEKDEAERRRLTERLNQEAERLSRPAEARATETTATQTSGADAPIPLADEPTPYRFADESPKAETPGPAEADEPIPLAGKEADTYPVKPERAEPVAKENTNPLFEANARGINQLAEANRQLQESLGDGSYLRQMKELIQLRDEELKLAREAADQELKARYGDTAPDSKTLSGIGQVMDAGPSWLKPVVAGIGGGKGGTLGAAADLAGAGGEAGLAGAMEAAGGPIGLVAAAAQAASAALDGMERGVERAGQGLTALAGNDGLGMLHAATGAVTDTLRQIPIVGDAFAKQIEVATAAVTVYTQVTEAFIHRGQELSRYNADLAAANAQANVNRLEADMKESEALGKSLAKLTENQSDVESNLRELVLPIKEAISGFLAEFSGVLKEGTGIAKEFAPVIKFFADLALALPTEALRLIGIVLKELHDWLPKNPFKQEPQPGDLNMLMQQLFQNVDRIPPQPAAGAGWNQVPQNLRPIMGGN